MVLVAAATGLTQTRLPIAHFAAPRAFTLSVETASEFRERPGLWPIVDRVDYPDDAVLRGRVEFATPAADATHFQVLVEAPGGLRRLDACDIGDKTTIGADGPNVSVDRRTCYFYVDLRPADLHKGVTISLIDTARQDRVGPPVSVAFRRETRYAFVVWKALMSV